MTDDIRLKAIAKALGEAKTVLVLSHKNPDGDAIGSTLGLGAGLRRLGKQVDMVNISGVPEALKWIPGSELITSEPKPFAEYDEVVILDCGELERTGFDTISPAPDKPAIIIDHHPGEMVEATDLIDIEAAATSELIYYLLGEMGAELSADGATALYVALFTDTGGFQFSNTDQDAFTMASGLKKCGVDPAFVASMLFEQENPARIRLLALALSTLRLSDCGKLASIFVDTEMFDITGTTSEDTDGFVNYPRSVEGVEVAILIKEVGENYHRLALRSRGRVNVSAIASELGGGGHHNAAGAHVTADPDTIFEMILEKVLSSLPN